MSTYGYTGYLGVTKLAEYLPYHTDFLIECLAQTAAKFIATKCDGIAKIERVNSYHHLFCFRVIFFQNVIINRVSMTFLH